MSTMKALLQDKTMSETVSSTWHYAMGAFASLCLIFGILSNGFVIFLFLSKKKLRRPRNYFLINLAITDLGLLLTNNSMHAIASFNRSWPFGQRGCDFYAVCGGVFGLTSIATMAAISLTRLAAVTHPFSSLKLTGSLVLKCLPLTWIYGSIWILPPLFGWSHFTLEGFGTSCTFNYTSQERYDRYFTLLLISGGFLLPLSIILLCYTIILRRLNQRTRHMTICSMDDDNHSIHSNHFSVHYGPVNRTLPDETRRPSTTIVHSIDDHFLVQNASQTETRATRNALIVVAIFCLAWAPYASMAFATQFGFIRLANVYVISSLGAFTKLAACINPLIYAFSSSGFRKILASNAENSSPCFFAFFRRSSQNRCFV